MEVREEEGGGGRNSLTVVEEDRVTGGLLETAVQVLDIVHRLRQDRDLRELLYLSSSRNMLPQSLKASVDSLHSFPLSLIPLDSLEILLRFYLVPVDRVESD